MIEPTIVFIAIIVLVIPVVAIHVIKAFQSYRDVMRHLSAADQLGEQIKLIQEKNRLLKEEIERKKSILHIP